MSLPCPEGVEYKHPVNATRAVPKSKRRKIHVRSALEEKKKIHSVLLLFNAAFLIPVSIDLLAHNQMSRNKACGFHYASGQCQPRTRNTCLLFRLQNEKTQKKAESSLGKVIKGCPALEKEVVYAKYCNILSS